MDQETLGCQGGLKFAFSTLATRKLVGTGAGGTKLDEIMVRGLPLFCGSQPTVSRAV